MNDDGNELDEEGDNEMWTMRMMRVGKMIGE